MADPQAGATPDAAEILGRMLAEDADENRRVRDELEQARQVQLSLFPAQFPFIPGYEFFGLTAPSHGVSGDYYEVFERESGGECVMLLADVAGHGLSASILTGFLEALTSISIERGLAPHDILNSISGPFFRRTPSRQHASMLLAVMNPAQGTVHYANAGHPPGLVVRASGGVHWLQPTGIPFGVLPDAEYLSDTTDLMTGDLLVLYSGGISSAIDPHESEFGADRLAGVISRHRSERLATIGARIEITIRERAAGRPIDSDLTLLLARRAE
jgi:sigma-B regulation protein RsbU (phosphoserine phosphatase)